MKSTFFARYSLIVLMIVMFLVPFALRGARFSIQEIKNDIKDWLPSDFEETQELKWFAQHFAGEQFVIVTWPGCTADDPRFEMFVEKARGEVAPAANEHISVAKAMGGASPPGDLPADDLAGDNVPGNGDVPGDGDVPGEDVPGDDAAADVAANEPDSPLTDENAAEIERARQLGDRLGLYTVGEYYKNWGGKDEKWLRGDGDLWYFVTPDGELYRWNGNNNLPSYLARRTERAFTGSNSAEGELVGQFGKPWTPTRSNIFHADPRKLTARLFKTVRTGPEILAELSSPNGPLWPRTGFAGQTDEAKTEIARERAYERLTGALFGPQPPADFQWTTDDLLRVLPEEQQQQLPTDWKERFTAFVEKLEEDKYDGQHAGLVAATTTARVRHWFELCREVLEIEPPAPQTAIMLTISDVGKRNLARVVGRPLMGKPRGKILDLAIGECNISADELKLGGPPVDNVAIDEEGTVTLVSLISYSALVGFVLAYISFRSFKVTMMVFFVGGVSAITSLSLVWWSSVIWPESPYSTVDAILLSMPSLVYVLGLSGAVHIVNYYREAAQEDGPAGAPEKAVSHGWWPCTLAAFTTALGLVSLCTSNILPIRKFGLFSAVGTMATLALLFTFLPAALQMWAPFHKRRRDGSDEPAIKESRLHALVFRFWERVGGYVVGNYALVLVVCLVVMFAFGAGLFSVNTSVQLLKLFDGDAKIIQDYEWLETHLGKLVPMELIVKVDKDMLQPTNEELAAKSERGERNPQQERYQLNFLERLEIAENVGLEVERAFGEQGTGVLGRGLRASTFLEDLPDPSAISLTSSEAIKRTGLKGKLEENRDQLLASDYVRVDKEDGGELWRVSLRLGALNDVDYGQFVGELKRVVEPVMSAYRYRDKILHVVDEQNDNNGFSKGMVLVLGAYPPTEEEDAAESNAEQTEIQPTTIFARVLNGLLVNAGVYKVNWHDPQKSTTTFNTSDDWAKALSQFDCVVVARDEGYDLDFINKHAKNVLLAEDHQFDPASDMPTCAKRDDTTVACIYTGVVPIVYKAQRTLLESLVNSIALAFVMIAVVMMFLLRNGKLSPLNFMNPSAGLISMLPNVFPVIIIFGAMGHLGVLIDIGTMMTASVAMGVAVDDTIHFLTWFRKGIAQGLSRQDAIRKAYGHVATAMTQTTLIGGLGLSVFALSTFTPTQGFGIMMLCLLATALVGDLVLLPALLASPLGAFFAPPVDTPDDQGAAPGAVSDGPLSEEASSGKTPHSSGRTQAASSQVRRRDDGHRRLGH
ncbi:MAG: MMPL family transporter [Pirellulaceae bacterium]